MPVFECHVCNKMPQDREKYGESGFANGIYCPVCSRPTCTHHLTTVRWRWKTGTQDVDSAKICQECRRTYEHRSWDIHNREWIS